MSDSTMTHTPPAPEEVEDFLLSCRYGELEEVQVYLERYGPRGAVEARDERGNTALHMCCGNGHFDILQVLLPHFSNTDIALPNASGSPALHWAVLNNHVQCVRLLVDLPESRGGGLPLLKQKNGAGRDAFAEAVFAGEGKEEVSGWIEGYLYRAEGGEEADKAAAATGEGEGEGEREVVVKVNDKGVGEVIERTEKVDLAG